jgi:hypothetical protein
MVIFVITSFPLHLLVNILLYKSLPLAGRQWLMAAILVTWDQDDHGSRPAQANSSQDPICKIIRAKWPEGVA